MKHISDTAFLVNESRARCPNVSLDDYARHWVPPDSRERVRQLWDDFTREVYPHDALELAVRNRFFLDHLRRTAGSDEDAVFVNLGAGFTSYPYLMEPGVPCIEVDFPHVVVLKRARAEALRARSVLPPRRVEYFAADLGDAEHRAGLRRFLAERIDGRRSYVLLEGVSYYLSKTALESVIGLARDAQVPGSVFAFDFWKPEIVDSAVFTRLQAFFARRFDYPPQRYNLFGLPSIEAVARYRPLLVSDVVEQERVYAGSTVLSETDEVLLESYALLERG